MNTRLFFVLLLLFGCHSEARDASVRDSGRHQDAAVFDAGPRPDALPDSGAYSDATPRDVEIIDAGQVDATDPDATSQDATIDSGVLDAGGPACNAITFSYQSGTASSVYVTGSFTNWGATPQEGAIAMTNNGSLWSVTTLVDPPGRHLYKFIVDGTQWIDDPNNPEREDDGHNGYNSVLHVCEAGFTVISHSTNEASRTFTAQVEYDGPDDPASATLSVDLVANPGALSIAGQVITISLSALTDGIHDLRLTVGTEALLLKVYINESTDWRDTLIYFVMTDRFKNGDTNNDAPIGGLHGLTDYLGGDFAGILGAIQSGYFDGLGVNALWLTWPLDNTDIAWEGLYKTADGCNVNGTATTFFSGYHGYWPSSGRDIESHFGTMQELQALVVAAHERGIRILLDFTANHVHQDSPLFSAHPGWFNQPPTLCRDGHWDDALKEECWFDSFLPDWNYTNADARRQVLDDAVWLAKETGADGFRVDALKHMEEVFIRELRARVERELEQTDIMFYMVGETFTGDTTLINHYVASDMMHGQFDFPTNMAVRQGFANDQVGLADMHTSVRGIKTTYGAASPYMSTFAGNHDIARFVSKASGDLPCGIWAVEQDQSRAFSSPPSQPGEEWPYRRLQLAMTYVFAVPGIPLVYYGDEVGLAGAGDPDNRRMLPEDNVLNTHQQALRTFMMQLGNLRATHAVLRTGDWTDALYGDATTLAFARTSPSQQAIIVINRGGDATIDVPVSSLGISDGTQLTAQLGTGSVSVSNGTASLFVPTVSSEIYLTP